MTGRIVTNKLRGPHRLFYVRKTLGEVIDAARPTLVVIEGYAMGVRGNNMFHIGELGGVLKTMLWDRGIDYIEIPPTVMKSAIALNGRAEKTDIIASLKTRFNLRVTQHDEADAAGLMLLGEMFAGARKVDKQAMKSGKADRFDAIRTAKVIKGRPQCILKSITNTSTKTSQ